MWWFMPLSAHVWSIFLPWNILIWILINSLTYDNFVAWLLQCRGMEIGDASRCFNCGSYNHSLKECPKPRDNIAVSNARKQQKTRRNQNASSRNPTRYYQSTPGGKYDGLKPGVLDIETRKLLGLGVRNYVFIWKKIRQLLF